MAVARRGHPRRHREDRAIRRGLTFDQFQSDEKTIDAVVRNLEMIGEAVRHLMTISDELPVVIPWADIAGMRNILVHEYFGVDLQIVWQTASKDLPMLKDELHTLLRDTGAG